MEESQSQFRTNLSFRLKAGYDPPMTILLRVLPVAFAAICMWLAVRIVNRREQWAIRVAVPLAAVVAYPLGLFPACWLVGNKILSARIVGAVYEPYFWLEFNGSESIQNAIARCATVAGIGSVYVELRDAPYLHCYPVSDLAFRWVNGRRVFYADREFLNIIACNVEPDSWEDLSGPGRLGFSHKEQALEVLQSRRVHSAVAAYLEEIRSLIAIWVRRRDVDTSALQRGFWERDPEPTFQPHIVYIENPVGDQFLVGESWFTDLDDLITFLEQKPRESLRAGIYWNRSLNQKSSANATRLEGFCRSRDLDLLIRPVNGRVNIGQPIPCDWWIVRASDSIYLDPE